MQNTFAKISAVVISPVFNEAELVPTFVYAVEDSLSDMELKLILVDDGSEDNIRDVFERFSLLEQKFWTCKCNFCGSELHQRPLRRNCSYGFRYARSTQRY